MAKISLGFSPCPNDTFMFHAMLAKLVDTSGLDFDTHIHDVEALNQMAFGKKLQVTKLSFFAYLKLQDEYEILDSGSALGYGCGPLLVASNPQKDLSESRIAIPGEFTTAHLLLRLWCKEIGKVEITRFDKVMPGVCAGDFDAGVIIHEGRFVFQDFNLTRIIDLGEWWEKETGLPISLGCIAIRKDCLEFKSHIEQSIRSSIAYGFSHRDASKGFIKEHAQEMVDEVIDSHIDLYVNGFSSSLGEKGRRAVAKLKEMAHCLKVA